MGYQNQIEYFMAHSNILLPNKRIHYYLFKDVPRSIMGCHDKQNFTNWQAIFLGTVLCWGQFYFQFYYYYCVNGILVAERDLQQFLYMTTSRTINNNHDHEQQKYDWMLQKQKQCSMIA